MEEVLSRGEAALVNMPFELNSGVGELEQMRRKGCTLTVKLKSGCKDAFTQTKDKATLESDLSAV